MWVAKVLSLYYLLVISVPMLSKSHGWLALMLLGWDHPASWSRPERGCQANLGPSLALSRTPCVTFNCICLSFRICKRRTKRKTCLLVELLGILSGTLSKHLVQWWRQSRPSMNDNCSRSLLHPQRGLHPRAEAILLCSLIHLLPLHVPASCQFLVCS